MRDRVHLFAVSLLVLFLELAAIRWFPAQVLFLTFFTNTVLLACFLAARKGTTIDLDVYAEFAPQGGEPISNSIVTQLEEVCEYLPDTKRPGVRFGVINYG